MYHLYFLLTNYTCKYHEICQYDHDIYVMTYIHMLRIYMSQASVRSAHNIHIYSVQHYECSG